MSTVEEPSSVFEELEHLARQRLANLAPYAGDLEVPSEVNAPLDVRAFFQRWGGAIIFPDAGFPIEIVGPADVVRTNQIVLGERVPDDITDSWFVIARSGPEQVVSIDFGQRAPGRCYDSFWDRHGVPGECDVVASNFSDFLRSVLAAEGASLPWLADDFVSLGDAYA